MRLGLGTAALVTVLALAGAGCALVGDDTGEGAGDGDTVAADGVLAIGAQPAVVQLPTGRMSVVLGDAVDSLTAGSTADGERRDAPDDGAFVGVGWTFAAGEGVSTTQKAMVVDDDVTAEVTLVAGGERYPIDAAVEDDPALFVAVSAAADVRLEVVFDGVVQAVSAGGQVAEGDAAPLYAAEGARAPLIDCSEQEWRPAATAEVLCSAELVLLPYVSGPGWAASGASWAVVRLETTVGPVEAGGRRSPVTGTEDHSTLDGDRPILTVPNEVVRAGFSSSQLVFDSSPDAPHVLDVERTYATDGATYTGTARVRLRP